MCQREDGVHLPRDVCPLCLEEVGIKQTSTPKDVERATRNHVSGHMEQLALFIASSTGYKVLEEDDSDPQDDEDSGDPFQGELRSIVSRDTHLSKRELQVANLKAFMEIRKIQRPELMSDKSMRQSVPQSSQESTSTKKLSLRSRYQPPNFQSLFRCRPRTSTSTTDRNCFKLSTKPWPPPAIPV